MNTNSTRLQTMVLGVLMQVIRTVMANTAFHILIRRIYHPEIDYQPSWDILLMWMPEERQHTQLWGLLSGLRREMRRIGNLSFKLSMNLLKDGVVLEENLHISLNPFSVGTISIGNLTLIGGRTMEAAQFYM